MAEEIVVDNKLAMAKRSDSEGTRTSRLEKCLRVAFADADCVARKCVSRLDGQLSWPQPKPQERESLQCVVMAARSRHLLLLQFAIDYILLPECCIIWIHLSNMNVSLRSVVIITGRTESLGLGL